MATTFYIEVDWGQTGSFTQEAATRLQGFIIRRGRRNAIGADGYQAVEAGVLNATVADSDGRYSLFNSGGSLYSNLRPNREVRILAVDPDLPGGERYLYSGFISNIVNQPERKQTRIEALDGIDWLGKRKGDDIGLQTDYTVASAITDILVAVDYPYVDTSGWQFPATFPITIGGLAVENNGDTIKKFWGQTAKTAWEGLQDISQAFAGDCYVAADGTFSYAVRGSNRNPILTLEDDDAIAGSQPEQPWAEIRNHVRVAVKALQSNAAVEIYRMYEVLPISAGKSVTVWCDFAYNGFAGPASSVTTPVSTTDYTANAQADGLGTDKTAQLGVAFTAYTDRAKAILTNNDAATIYVTLFKIRGTILTTPIETAMIGDDATSQAEFEKRTLNINSLYMQEAQVAQYHADYAASVFADPRKVLWLRVVGRPSVQLLPDLFDVVTLNMTTLGATGDYKITYIEHDFAPKKFYTTWRLEPVVAAGWVFPMTFPATLGW